MIDTHKDSVTLSPDEEVLPQDVSQAGVGNKALRELMGIIDSPTATEETSEAAVIEDKSPYTVQELLSLAVFASLPVCSPIGGTSSSGKCLLFG